MNDLPPEIRQALFELLIVALRELLALIAQVASHIMGTPTPAIATS